MHREACTKMAQSSGKQLHRDERRKGKRRKEGTTVGGREGKSEGKKEGEEKEGKGNAGECRGLGKE